jgi:hypothetical protein
MTRKLLNVEFRLTRRPARKYVQHKDPLNTVSVYLIFCVAREVIVIDVKSMCYGS